MSSPILDLLKEELRGRSRKNPSYSIRAFARSLGIDQSLLTKAINGSRKLSPQMEVKIGQVLGVPAKKLNQLRSDHKSETYKNLEEMDFEILSDWTHFGILELMSVPGFKSDTRWIASRLRISPALVRPAIQRLIERGFIQEKKGQWICSSPHNTWSNTTKTSEARKSFQKQLLALGIQAIDEVPFDEREAASLTIACDPKILPEVKTHIQKFKNELRAFIEAQGEAKEVYQLCLSFSL